MTTTADLLRLAAAGSPWKRACRVCAASNVSTTAIGLGVVDTVQLEAGDRVLLTAQATAAENGIWIASSGAWWRADDWGADGFAQLGTSVVVLEGTNAGVWTMTSPTTGDRHGSIEIGTDEPSFEVTSFLSHGDLPGGTLHAVATGASPGFMPLSAVSTATASRIVTRDSNGAAAFSALEAVQLRPVDAPDVNTEAAALYVSGGRVHTDAIGDAPWANVVVDMGICATSTSGESGGVNFRYGDLRSGNAEAQWIGAELTFVGTPGSRTPAYFRIHAGGPNPETNETFGMRLLGRSELLLASEVYTGLEAPRIRKLFPSPVSLLAHIEGFRATTTGAETKTIWSLHADFLAGDLAAQCWHVSARITKYQQGVARAVFARACGVLVDGVSGSYKFSPDAESGPGSGTVPSGLYFTESGTGLALIAVGTAGQTLTWTGVVEIMEGE